MKKIKNFFKKIIVFIKWKRVLMVILTYLIPIINIIILYENYCKKEYIIVCVCSVLASTAAASACTIKGIQDESQLNKLTIAQAFALVLSVFSFVICLIYQIENKLFISLWILIVLTFIANIVAIYMFLVSDKQIENIVNQNIEYRKEQEEAKKFVKKADEKAKNTSTIKLTKKGGK